LPNGQAAPETIFKTALWILPGMELTVNSPQTSTPKTRKSSYRRHLRSGEVEELEQAQERGLQDEIAILRVVIRRVFDAANQANMDLDTWSDTLNTLGSASTRLAGLLKAQRVIGESGAQDILSQALAEIAKEMNLP
jgi:hypothetical protein